MRVVLLNQYYAPAEAPTGLLLADVGQSLAAAGHEVTAVCSDRDYADPERRYPLHDRRGGVAIRRIRGTGFGRTRRVGRVLDYLSFMITACLVLLGQRRPDVVVALTTPPMLALPVWLIARLRRARFVFWVMDVYPDLAFELGVVGRGSPVGLAFRGLARRVLRGADLVVALGPLMAERLRQAGARRVEVVHNWADGEAIRPRDVASHPLRRERSWNGRLIVLYAGNLGLAHDFDTVLDGAELLRDRPEVRFAFVGSGPRADDVRRQAAERGLDNVEFWPWMAQQQLGLSLTSGDVHVITLRPGLEGLLVPSKLYGILAAGRPAIYVGPEASEIAEILARWDCGRVVRPGAAREFADAVRRYADDEALRTVHGQRARAAFDAAFDRPRALRRWIELIDSVGPASAG